MDKRKLMAIAAVLAVLTFGALGFASHQSSQSHAAQQSAQAENSRADTDNVQQGGGNQVEDSKHDLPGTAENGD